MTARSEVIYRLTTEDLVKIVRTCFKSMELNVSTFRGFQCNYGCHKLAIPKIMVKVKEAERVTDIGRFGHLQNGRSSKSISHVSVESAADAIALSNWAYLASQ